MEGPSLGLTRAVGVGGFWVAVLVFLGDDGNVVRNAAIDTNVPMMTPKAINHGFKAGLEKICVSG